MVKRLFLAVPRGSLQFVIVVFPDHTHYFDPGGIVRSVDFTSVVEQSSQGRITGSARKGVKRKLDKSRLR